MRRFWSSRNFTRTWVTWGSGEGGGGLRCPRAPLPAQTAAATPQASHLATRASAADDLHHDGELGRLILWGGDQGGRSSSTASVSTRACCLSDRNIAPLNFLSWPASSFAAPPLHAATRRRLLRTMVPERPQRGSCGSAQAAGKEGEGRRGSGLACAPPGAVHAPAPTPPHDVAPRKLAYHARIAPRQPASQPGLRLRRYWAGGSVSIVAAARWLPRCALHWTRAAIEQATGSTHHVLMLPSAAPVWHDCPVEVQNCGLLCPSSPLPPQRNLGSSARVNPFRGVRLSSPR
jgi:hypothetical protein